MSEAEAAPPVMEAAAAVAVAKRRESTLALMTIYYSHSALSRVMYQVTLHSSLRRLCYFTEDLTADRLHDNHLAVPASPLLALPRPGPLMPQNPRQTDSSTCIPVFPTAPGHTASRPVAAAARLSLRRLIWHRGRRPLCSIQSSTPHEP